VTALLLGEKPILMSGCYHVWNAVKIKTTNNKEEAGANIWPVSL
jgi:hypothetical protein